MSQNQLYNFLIIKLNYHNLTKPTKLADNEKNRVIKLMPPVGFEPATSKISARCSIH